MCDGLTIWGLGLTKISRRDSSRIRLTEAMVDAAISARVLEAGSLNGLYVEPARSEWNEHWLPLQDPEKS
jgi:hypothetical protein